MSNKELILSKEVINIIDITVSEVVCDNHIYSCETCKAIVSEGYVQYEGLNINKPIILYCSEKCLPCSLSEWEDLCRDDSESYYYLDWGTKNKKLIEEIKFILNILNLELDY